MLLGDTREDRFSAIMSDQFRVKEETRLLDSLVAQLPGWKRNRLRERIQSGCVSVNGAAVTSAKTLLAAGDEVVVAAQDQPMRRDPAALQILHQDEALIAIYKPEGLLSVATERAGNRHALGVLREQISPPRKKRMLWPVHRLDRETSGVLLFATSREIKETVSASWSQAEKVYLAVVEGRPEVDAGTIEEPLRMDAKGFRAHVGAHPEAKRAITHYRVVEKRPKRSLLEVRLGTGRQHQIRAHLAWLGHPVVGDERYGSGDRRLGLHALRLQVPHPLREEPLLLEAPAPSAFLDLLR